MDNSEQIEWLKKELSSLRIKESKLFDILINHSKTDEEIKICVGTIISLSSYILRMSNAINRMEETPGLFINLKLLNSPKDDRDWR